MAVAVEKRVRTARGEVEVDVYAEESVRGRQMLILVECKHWSSRLPQSVVHAFRTVVAETGANQGYLVSKVGFQPAALSAAEHTNLQLVTWEEFQGALEETWIHHHLLPTVKATFDRWFREADAAHSAGQPFDRLSEQGEELRLAAREELIMRYLAFVEIMRQRFSSRTRLPALPLREVYGSELDGEIPAAILDATGYRELLDAATAHADVGIAEWVALFGTG